MAVLEKIRVKLGIFITVIIAVALLSFIIDPSTLEMTWRNLSSKYDVGEINGNSIRYEEYQQKVDYYTNIYTLTSGNQSVSEEALETIYASAWQDLESEFLMIPTIKKGGINVGTEELLDLSQGKELSPIIAQEPSFRDETGKFSRNMLLQFIKAIPQDQTGRLETYWNFLEQNMERQQYFTKYASLLTRSNIATPVEIRRNVQENNEVSDVDFLMVPFGFSQDTTIKISNKEIETYYNEHKDMFKQNASRDVEFVVYEVVPSEKDFELVENAINKVYNDFITTENLKNFLAHNSDKQFSNYYYKQGELSNEYPELDEFAFANKVNDVLPIFKKDNSFVAAKIVDIKMLPDSIFVQHILLPVDQDKKADSLLAVLKNGADFSSIAREYSLDKNPNVQNVGDLGWLTQSVMLPGMESLVDAQINKYQKLSTQFGLHIVKVTQKTKPNKKVQLAVLSKEVVSGKEAFQSFYSKANELASKSEGKIENFNKIVEEEKLPVVPAFNVIQGAKKLSKYEHTKEISRWIYESKEGDVSPIITVDNKYFFVVALKKVREEGYATVNESYDIIKNAVMFEKKGEKILKEVTEKVANLSTLEQMAEALNTTVTSKNDISFGSVSSRSFDPILVGAVSSAEIGKVSKPILGNVGIYIYRVNNREVGSFYTEDDAKLRGQQISNYQINMIPTVLNEIGKVKDNRAKFF